MTRDRGGGRRRRQLIIVFPPLWLLIQCPLLHCSQEGANEEESLRSTPLDSTARTLGRHGASIHPPQDGGLIIYLFPHVACRMGAPPLLLLLGTAVSITTLPIRLFFFLRPLPPLLEKRHVTGFLTVASSSSSSSSIL